MSCISTFMASSTLRARSSGVGFRYGYCLMSNLLSRPRCMFASYILRTCTHWRRVMFVPFSPPMAMSSLRAHKSVGPELCGMPTWHSVRFNSTTVVTLNTDNNFPRFSIIKAIDTPGVQKDGMQKPKRPKMSRKAKLNQLKWYRLKAKKKMRSPNPEVRIQYKLQKAKRKEEWLIEKLRKFDVPKGPEPVHDPEILTVEERFYLKRTGEKKKNYVNVGRRGVFGGVVLNMHLHWKTHETVKVVCKPCRPGQVHEYAEEIARLSKGTIIDIKHNTIVFYRGKNYVQPAVMSPPNTLSKQKALEKYKFQQSLEHTSQFIERLEKELEEYHNHVAMYRKNSEDGFSKSDPVSTSRSSCSLPMRLTSFLENVYTSLFQLEQVGNNPDNNDPVHFVQFEDKCRCAY